MQRSRFVAFAAIISLGSVAWAQDAVVEKMEDKVVKDANSAAGWVALFDGKTLNGWRTYNEDKVKKGWVAKDGELRLEKAGGGDLITEKQYENFELKLEWKIPKGRNSGLFFGAKEIKGPIYNEALEVQILGNEGSLKATDLHIAGAVYGFYPSKRDWAKPDGEWNSTVIHKMGTQVKITFNGHLVADFKTDGDGFKALHAKSKFKGIAQFGQHAKGHIGFQDHGDSHGLALRNIMIRELP